MKKITKAILLSSILVLSVPVLAFKGGAGHGLCGKHLNPMQKFEQMSLILDLTDEQKSNILPLIEQQIKNKRSGQNRKKLMKALHDVVEEGGNQTEIDAIAKQAANSESQRVLDQAKVMAAFNRVLTAQQKEKLKKLESLQHQKKQGHRQGAPKN